jgi:uncharacterized cupin superfamily protein
VSVKKVNILTVELDERLDEHGFRHAATSVGARLGARRIGAAVYQADAGFPIWPYHYHHGIEEWLYVIAGDPVLRDLDGERSLTPGDLVRFPSGPSGSHTLKGPGRFVIFDTADAEPYMSVYPDSDKASGPEGMLLRSSVVGYWHGEGTGGPVAEEATEREPSPPPPRRLAAAMTELDPGEESEPYHYVYGREEWLVVESGTLALRHADGEHQLEAGDVVCFPEGPAGARHLANRSGSAVRALSLWTTGLPANVFYPDSGQWLIRNGPGAEFTLS